MPMRLLSSVLTSFILCTVGLSVFSHLPTNGMSLGSQGLFGLFGRRHLEVEGA